MFVRVTYVFFFFNDTAPTEIYTLSLHDALPILQPWERLVYSTSFTRFRLQFLENGGTNFCGGVRSSPLMTFSVCSLPSLAITKTVAASPSLRISGVAFSALGQIG